MGNSAVERVNARRELRVFILYLALIVIAEFTASLFDPTCGLLLHSLIFLSLLILAALWYGDNPASSLLQSLSLAPLIRILSLSLPLFYFPRYAWYLVAGIPVLVAEVTIIRVQGLGLSDIGLTFKRPLAQACIALTGIPLGAIEYFILKPQPLALGLSTLDYALLALALIVCTGFFEELAFRGILQNSAVKSLGEMMGVIGVNAVFAALHIGWLSIIDVVFVFLIGLFFALLTLETGSIVGVSLAHGVTNVVLFLVMPLLPLIL